MPTPLAKDRGKRILVVEDDPELRREVAAYLRGLGLTVFEAEDAEAMDACLATEAVDLLVLDLGLPGEDGLSICRRLRSAGGPAIVMASAAGDEVDRVLGLELGADDYLPKPFSPRELAARIRAVLRRHDGSQPAARGADFLFGGFSYDPARRILKAPSGEIVPLTGAESSLLGALLLNPNRVMNREELSGSWSPSEGGEADAAGESRAVDLQISRLRRKLQMHGGGRLILTERGLGYALRCEVTR